MPQITIQLDTDKHVLAEVEFPAEEGYVIGRSDENSDFIPDIDLAALGAREMGVSRRHVALIRYRGAPHLLDLFSVNGTFLNGKRLMPDTPYPLDGSNAVRLGTLQLTISRTQ